MDSVLLTAAGALAGVLGSMLGIGGGVLLVPMLVLGFGIPIEAAVPVSLLCVVANSCASAANYVENHLSDVRLAMTLELATVAGAVVGGLVAGLLAPAFIALTFGLFTLYVALQMLVLRATVTPSEAGTDYEPTNYPLGISGSFVAGGLSSLLGVGGGPLKVPLMTFGMGVPFRVATATSNLMIGITAAASVASYAWHGHLDLALASKPVVGVLLGAALGSRLMLKTSTVHLRRLFALVLLAVASQMLWKGGRGLWPNL
jgi:uncharacterized membrane protein YfcA